jgi:hypothetical protein
MAIDPIKQSRIAARLMVAGFIVAVVGAGLAAEPFAAMATFGAGLFLLGLALGIRARRTLVQAHSVHHFLAGSPSRRSL